MDSKINQVWQEIQQKLEILKQKVQKPESLEFFGASKHKYCLNPCLSEVEIQDFERRYSVVLPDDYRDFLQYVGNGGAGPKYGVLPLEDAVREVQQKIIELPQEYVDRMMQFYKASKLTDKDYLEIQSSQRQIQNFITNKLERGEVNYNILAEPFPLTNVDALAAIKQRLKDLQTDEAYFIDADYPLCGSLPICHQGCGWMNVLVITGEQRGQMWTAGEGWLPEFSYEQPTQKDFLDWYQTWLDDSICRVYKWEE